MGRNFPLELSGSIWWGEGKKEGKKKREKKKKEEKRSEKLHIFSRIHGDWAVSFLRRERQSSSMRRDLRVGTRI